MKGMFIKMSAVALATVLITPAIHAQDDKDKEKDKPEKKSNTEQIIITKKGGDNDKVVVEINGDKITVNGKPIEDLKDGDISVNVNTLKGLGSYNFNWNNGHNMLFEEDENTAMLGVVTDKADEGVTITDVTNESGADKAGLKEEDVITKVDDKKIDDPDDLTKVIRAHKPGDKVTITYLRDKKENKLTAELTKWKGGTLTALAKMPNMEWNQISPKMQGTSKFKMSPGQYYAFGQYDRPRLGLSVQDMEDGKGVKVTDVDDDGNAKKAGVKEDDIILTVNDKEVNSADEVARIVRESREKNSFMLKVKRGDKTQNIEVKMPKKLKTADL